MLLPNRSEKIIDRFCSEGAGSDHDFDGQQAKRVSTNVRVDIEFLTASNNGCFIAALE